MIFGERTLFFFGLEYTKYDLNRTKVNFYGPWIVNIEVAFVDGRIKRSGGIQQLRGQNLAIFYREFLYPERGQKQTYFDHLLPPHDLVHVVFECPLSIKSSAYDFNVREKLPQ